MGIPQIFVFDPEAHDAWAWSQETDNMERIQVLRLGNGKSVDVQDIWAELERRTKPKD